MFALDGTGKRMREVKSADGATKSRFKLGAEHRTLWYEIEWGEESAGAMPAVPDFACY